MILAVEVEDQWIQIQPHMQAVMALHLESVGLQTPVRVMGSYMSS